MSAPVASYAVGGTFILNFIDQTTGLAVLSGDLQGAVRGVIRTQTTDADGVMHLTLEHVMTLTSGDSLMTQDEATMTPLADGLFLFRQTQTVVKGTGAWEGAAGTLTEFGVVDMGKGGLGVLRYSGRLSHR
jgi:hypothetical protein